MRRIRIILLLMALATLLNGCKVDIRLNIPVPNPNPVGVGSNTLAILLDEQGNYHSFIDKPGRIYLTDKRGSFLNDLTGVRNPVGWVQLAPSDQRLLYVTAEELKKDGGIKRWGLHLYDLLTHTDRKLAESDDEISAPSFSPQEDKVAYLIIHPEPDSGMPVTELHVLDLVSGDVKLVRDDPKEGFRLFVWNYHWSGGGQQLLLLRSFVPINVQDDTAAAYINELTFYDLIENRFSGVFYVFSHPLWLGIAPSTITYANFIDWSSDGTKILIMASEPIFSSDVQSYRFQLYLIQIAGPHTEDPVSLKLLATNAGSPSFSPQGKKIAFICIDGPAISVDGDPESIQAWIFAGHSSGEGLQQIAGPGRFTYLFWISEEELGYVEEKDDGAIIWIHNLATGERFNLSAALASWLRK